LAGDIFGRKIKAHQAAWSICTGRHPANVIDHINGDPKDNRICNLREATSAQNSLNRRGWSKSTSRFKGVCSAKGGRWRAQIRVPLEKPIHLGVFDTEHEAAKAYNEAAIRLHGEWARLNTVA
jgi:hypothetical protein